MSERKVLNKYIPPDFDPSALKRVKNKDKTGPKQQTVRLMTPFSMRCNACGEYIYKGKKFNARKEDTLELYYSVKIYRFHIKCTRCSSPITFRTDPKHADYAAESGAQRNFEPWRTEPAEGADDDDDETELDKLAEEENVMDALESKTMDAKKEMEVSDALDEIRTRNATMGRVDVDSVIKRLQKRGEEEIAQVVVRKEVGEREAEQRDREIAKSVFAGAQGDVVRRIQEGSRNPSRVSESVSAIDPATPVVAGATGAPNLVEEDNPARASVGAECAGAGAGAGGGNAYGGVLEKVATVKFAPAIVKKRERGSLLGVKIAKKTKLI